jgi:DNA repair protein RadB
MTDDYKEVLSNIIFFKPTSFAEQKQAFEKLKEAIDDKVGLIVVDSIAMLYRLELGKTDDIYNVNRELGQQISYLTEIARKKNIPVLLTNQVYANFDDKTKVNMVGGDILKYGSKCLIELHLNETTRRRKAVLRKHRFLPELKQINFRIEEKGIEKEELEK